MIRRAVVLAASLVALSGCMRAVDIHSPGPGVQNDLLHRRVKIIVRDPEEGGRRHALVVDVTDGGFFDRGDAELRGRVHRDAIETNSGIWAEVPPAKGEVRIPYADIEAVSRGPTGEEIASGIVAGICSGLCQAAAEGAFK